MFDYGVLGHLRADAMLLGGFSCVRAGVTLVDIERSRRRSRSPAQPVLPVGDLIAIALIGLFDD